MTGTRASEARLLRAVSRALEPFDTDLADIEKRAATHERNDQDRFLQLHQGQASLEHQLEFVNMRLEIMHDQLIEGLRELGAKIRKRDPNEVTPKDRRGKNGR